MDLFEARFEVEEVDDLRGESVRGVYGESVREGGSGEGHQHCLLISGGHHLQQDAGEGCQLARLFLPALDVVHLHEQAWGVAHFPQSRYRCQVLAWVFLHLIASASKRLKVLECHKD